MHKVQILKQNKPLVEMYSTNILNLSIWNQNIQKGLCSNLSFYASMSF